jgi:hypothetical protein
LLSRSFNGFSIAPYDEATLYKAGIRGNWRKLRSILEPIVDPAFAVTDRETQRLVDTARQLFDESVDHLNYGAVCQIAWGQERGGRTLEQLLSIGVDPDVPGAKIDGGFRLSHLCCQEGWRETASVVYLCRPDMTARNENNDTPLMAAESDGVYEARSFR